MKGLVLILSMACSCGKKAEDSAVDTSVPEPVDTSVETEDTSEEPVSETGEPADTSEPVDTGESAQDTAE